MSKSVRCFLSFHWTNIHIHTYMCSQIFSWKTRTTPVDMGTDFSFVVTCWDNWKISWTSFLGGASGGTTMKKGTNSKNLKPGASQLYAKTWATSEPNANMCFPSLLFFFWFRFLFVRKVGEDGTPAKPVGYVHFKFSLQVTLHETWCVWIFLSPSSIPFWPFANDRCSETHKHHRQGEVVNEMEGEPALLVFDIEVIKADTYAPTCLWSV